MDDTLTYADNPMFAARQKQSPQARQMTAAAKSNAGGGPLPTSAAAPKDALVLEVEIEIEMGATAAAATREAERGGAAAGGGRREAAKDAPRREREGTREGGVLSEETKTVKEKQWEKRFDAEYGEHYYFNKVTNESVWENPDEPK